MAELAAAIDGAQSVAWRLGTTRAGCLEARDLYCRLEDARVELERLRFITAQLRAEIDPWLAEQLGALQPPETPGD